MTTMQVHRRQPVAARRVGYVVSAGVNLVLLYLVNRSPGWRVLPFLAEDFTRVLGLVNASMVAAIVLNLAYTLVDPRWFRALGDIVTTSIGLAGLVRMWQVFPFDFGASSVDWELVARVGLGVAIGGCLIAVVVGLVTFVRSL